MLFNRSITTQFTVMFVVALLLVVGSFYLVLDSVYRNELKSQAETVADNVDAFGSWFSQYGRIWVRDDNKSYLGQVTLVSAPDATGGPAPADVVGPLQVALLVSAFVVAVLFIQFAVVRPIQRVTRAAERISVGQQADLGAAGLKRTSRNEIHQLILATERLRASLMLAMQRLTKEQNPPTPPNPPA